MPSQHGSGFDHFAGSVGRDQPPGGRFFTRRMFVMLAVVGTVLLLVFGFIFGMKMIVSGFMKSMVQAQTVSTVHAQSMVWQAEIKAVGSLHALEGADLAPEVAGIVTRIGFVSGQDVKKGALLFQLRDDTEQAAAGQAMANYRRAAALIKTQAISQSDYDAALANMRSTQAEVEKKVIRAPFDGRTGIRQADLGQYVGAGTTLVTLQRLDPIYVDFQVPQQQLAQVVVGRKIDITTDAIAGRTFTGEISAFDPKVDPATRMLHVRATIRNSAKQLLPGMFAAVTVEAGHARANLTLPQTAITFSPYGDTVFVVGKNMVKFQDGKDYLVVQQRFVTLGNTRGDQVAVVSGITATDVVVSSGQVKLKNGTPVTVNNDIRLPNDANPTPVQQ
jgi:membrane fusion protein, multidrug efflux system